MASWFSVFVYFLYERMSPFMHWNGVTRAVQIKISKDIELYMMNIGRWPLLGTVEYPNLSCRQHFSIF